MPGMDGPERLSAVRGFSGAIAGRPGARLRALVSHVAAGQWTQTQPFDPGALDEAFDPQDYVHLEVKQSSRLYILACAYVSRHGRVQSFRYSPDMEPGGAEDEGAPAEVPSLTTIGLGIFPFAWRGHELYALHQAMGAPVGTGNSIDVYNSLVLFARCEAPRVLGEFCRELIANSERTQAGFVNVFEWHPVNKFWQARVIIQARPIESVVLDQDAKDRLLADIEEFLGQETRRWYKEHGIQHKRGYLFYGPPGTGKTSLVQALAGLFEQNLCFVHLSHPQLTDESLRAAVNQSPKSSMLVFEDVDAIFGRDREKLLLDSALTFSGLLNALDGVGKADGQIFVLTTNHRDRLNPALVRNGRADLHVEFTHSTDAQISGMFSRFYPASTQRTVRHFVERLRAALGGRAVTPAALQHFFIVHRKSPAARAAECVRDIVDELELRADEQRSLEDPRGQLAEHRE